MSSLTRSECADFLRGQDHFAILTHRRPDGDTVGSAATLCLGLRKLGKIAHIIENSEITARYRHLHTGLTKAWPEDGDTVVSVDVASEKMLPDAFRSLVGKIALRIDHHETVASFTERELVEPCSASCGEIVYDVLTVMGVDLDKAMAEALYTAVSTDTGCFRYANTTAHALRTAAACAEAGGDLFTINQVLFDTNSFRKLKIQSWITEHTEFLTGGQIAVCALPKAVEEKIGADEDDLDGISGFLRSIEGVKIAALLRELPGGAVKASVRAVPEYDAAAVCAKFGGGGHRGAAGCTLKMPLAEAAEAIKKAMPEI
jgi:phosphoesterase RecJ-like protein